MPKPLRPGNVLRFLFDATDQARIDVTSIRVEDVPYDAAPAADRQYPQSLRLTFKVNDPENGPPQIRPLFPGNLAFVPDAAAPGISPDPAAVAFTAEAYDAWKTEGTLQIQVTDSRVKRHMQTLAPDLAVEPSIVWYGPVRISQAFLFDSLRRGLRRDDVKYRKRQISAKNENWDKHAVAMFLQGIYHPVLRLGNSIEQDDVQVHSMPTVVMANDGTVSLVITVARICIPKDGKSSEFDTLAGMTPQTSPAHPRYGAIPARHVYRSFRLGLIDATPGNPFPDAVLADWPAAPRYFALRFTRIWQPLEDCSIYFPQQAVRVEGIAGGPLQQRLPAHGLFYLAQQPANPEPSPPTVIVSVAGGMRFLCGGPNCWRERSALTPLQFDLSQETPHIVMRRRMGEEILADKRRPAPGGMNCTYLSLRRTVRALVDHRITGGRLNFGPRETSETTRQLMNAAWQNTPARAHLVANDQPSPFGGPALAAILEPILRAFFPDEVPAETIDGSQDRTTVYDGGQVAYRIWQSILASFQNEGTKRNFRDGDVGRGAPGGMVAIGLATYHVNPSINPQRNPGEGDAQYFDRIVGAMLQGLEPGAVLQFWNLNSDYEDIRHRRVAGNALPPPINVHYGHSPIFLEYLPPDANGVPTGIRVIDQSPQSDCLVVNVGGSRRLGWWSNHEQIWIAATWEE